ncbi:hypothetical protein RB595_005302 [Gaeumannomyces hyphopodioides]
MASNTRSLGQGPLSTMSQISPIAYLYRPSAQVAPVIRSLSKSASPKLIIVCSWMGARDQHIAKYIVRYQVVHPTSQILLIRSEFAHVRDPGFALRELQPAVPALRAVFGDSPATPSSSEPELLVHLFSNGGSSMLCHLYSAYKPLPRHVTIFDSAPGQWSYKSSLAAISAGVSGWKRFLLTPFFHALVIGYYVQHFVLPWNRARGDNLARWAAIHNNPAVNSTEARRAYIYSKEDKLIEFDAVEEHGRDAKQKGFKVRLERFVGTDHVAHARTEVERYWRIVDETWRGSA